MKLGVRLGLGFVVPILFLIGVGVFGLVSLHKTDLNLESVYKDRVIPLEELKLISDAYTVEVIDSVNKANAGLITAEQAYQKVASAQDLINKNWNDYALTKHTPEEAKLVQELEQLFVAANRDKDAVKEVLHNMSGSVEGELTKYDGTLYASIDPVIKEIGELMELQLRVSEEIYNEALVTFDQTVNMSVALIVIAIVLCGIVGYLVTRSITQQIGGEPAYAMGVVKAIADGELKTEIVLKNGDNTSILAAINNMKECIRLFITDMNHMSSEHDKGDIDVVIRVDRFNGDFSEMARGVNDMVNGHIAVKKKAMAVVKAFGDGNFDAPLEQFPGKKAFINETIEQVRSNLHTLIEDTDHLVDSALAGQLQIRADESRHKGDFRKIVKGINSTLDAIVDPITEVKRVLTAMSVGDLNGKITKNYTGEFDDLKGAVNSTVGKLTDTIDQVRTAIDAILSASNQVSATAQTISQSANEQAASVEETSASIEQMSASVNHNTENSKTTDGIASRAAKDASEGGKSVNQTVEAMKSIADKISIIDDIAYQTNLLALNAAIEAARAGEQGKGFAVVAAEVRKLAERSQVAAEEIGEVAASSVDLAEHAGELLNKIVPSIQQTSDLVREITAASEEQSVGADQINSAINQLNGTTQQNAAASEELAATAEEMSGQANQLDSLMSFFKTNNNLSTYAIKQETAQDNSEPVKMSLVANGDCIVPSEDEYTSF